MTAPLVSAEWPPEKLTILIAAVQSGNRSYADIAREFGVSPNSVYGKIGRLRALGLVSLPQRGATVEEAQQQHERVSQRTDPLALLKRQATLPLPMPMPFAHPKTCQWPMWKDDERPGMDPRFCGVRAEAGKPYCACHWAKAHTPRVWLP